MDRMITELGLQKKVPFRYKKEKKKIMKLVSFFQTLSLTIFQPSLYTGLKYGCHGVLHDTFQEFEPYSRLFLCLKVSEEWHFLSHPSPHSYHLQLVSCKKEIICIGLKPQLIMLLSCQLRVDGLKLLLYNNNYETSCTTNTNHSNVGTDVCVYVVFDG